VLSGIRCTEIADVWCARLPCPPHARARRSTRAETAACQQPTWPACSSLACLRTGLLSTADTAPQHELAYPFACTSYRWRAPPAADSRKRVGRVRTRRVGAPWPDWSLGGAAGRSGCCCGRSRRGSSRAAARCATSCAPGRPARAMHRPRASSAHVLPESWRLHSRLHITACLLPSGANRTRCG